MGGAFVRTPKLNLSNSHKGNKNIDLGYIPPISGIVWMEIALGIYALITAIVLQPSLGWGVVLWMVLYMLGYFYIAGLNLIQHMPVKDKGMAKSYAR